MKKNFVGVSLTGETITGGIGYNFIGCSFNGCTFVGRFNKCTFVGCFTLHAHCDNAIFYNCTFAGGTWYELAGKFKNCNFGGTIFNGEEYNCTFIACEFAGIELPDYVQIDCKMVNCKIVGAYLGCTIIENLIAVNCQFTGNTGFLSVKQSTLKNCQTDNNNTFEPALI